MEHTKVGMWFYNCSNVVVDGCRLRDTLADGINLCVGMREYGGSKLRDPRHGRRLFCHLANGFRPRLSFNKRPRPAQMLSATAPGQLPFLANGGAIYGGADNPIEDCLFKDISPGCGILISSTFPTSDDELNH